MSEILDYIHRQEEEIQSLLLYIRQFILDMHPDVTEKIRYGAPFFDYLEWMCYLNPIKKGKVQIGVDVCFIRGMEMMDTFELLEDRGRKMVKSVIFHRIEDVDEAAFHATLLDAMHVNQLYKDLKAGFKK